MKQQQINNREVPSIDHLKSKHSLSLQRSNYLCIEHDEDKIEHLVNEKDALVTDPRAQVNLRYCHPEEVNKIRMK